MRAWAIMGAAGALQLVALLLGQEPAVSIQPRQKSAPQEELRRPDLRVDTSLVLIPVSVNDPRGRPVAGLQAENFRITDNNEPQMITSFSMEDEPVALGLVFDTSDSMRNSLAQARRAAALFVATANPGDQFLLVEFDSKPRLTVPLTEDLAHIRYELTFTQSRGSTAMIDAVYMAMHEIKKSPRQRKALILVSDGDDNNSRYSASELRTVLQESEVLVYSVGMFVANSGLPNIAATISLDLRNRYVLGYLPTDPARNGLYHKVELELLPPKGLPKLKAYWRRGYYAPSE
jgi:hypothetical protein